MEATAEDGVEFGFAGRLVWDLFNIHAAVDREDVRMETGREAMDVGRVGHDDARAPGEHHCPGGFLVDVINEVFEDWKAVTPPQVFKHPGHEEKERGEPDKAQSLLQQEGRKDVGHEVRDAIDDVIGADFVRFECLPNRAHGMSACAQMMEPFVLRVDWNRRDDEPGTFVDFVFRERLGF